MNRSLVFILIFLALTERVFTVNLGSVNIGLFDIYLLLFLIYSISQKKILIENYYRIYIFYFVLSNILIFFFINNNIAITSIVTIPIKLLLVCYLAKNIILDKLFIQISILSFFFLSIGLIFISDGSPFFDVEVLNRNETIAYMLSIVYLMPDSNNKIRIRLLIILILLSFLVQSRQILVGLLFSSLIFIIYNFRIYLKFLPIIILICFSSFYLFNEYYFEGLDDYNQRRFNLDEIEERTRGDRIRYYNIIYGLEKFSDNPIIGHGTGSFIRSNPLNRVSHNSYITSLYENVIIGLLFFIILLYRGIPSKQNKLSFFIFFLLIAELFFIESMGKFFIYLYLIKGLLLRSNKIEKLN